MGLLAKIFPPAGRDAFARRIVRRIARAHPDLSPRYNPADFSISSGKGDETIFLHNAYEEYKASPVFKRKQVIAFYATFRNGPEDSAPDDLASARANLLPRVRERFYLSSCHLMTAVQGMKTPEIAFRLLNDDLTIEVVYDTPTAMSTLSPKHLETWGVTFDEALKIARDNLWNISKEDWKQIQPGLFMAPWSDFHCASRLFLHDLVWQLPVKGKHVAMIPNRNLLLVAGDEDHAALVTMAGIANEAATQPRFMTGSAFRLNGTKWELFLPAPTSPAYQPLRTLHIQSMGQVYGEQQRLLNEFYEKHPPENPPFVASFSAMSKPGEPLTTFAAWTEGIDSLLPETDRLAFVSNASGQPKAIGFLDGPTARRELADLLELQSDYPFRWRTKGFPTAQRLAKLGIAPMGRS